jgi:tRNA pseudouridine55 synthase
MNGILLIDKPEGWTSSDVVVKLKGVLHERRIGHAGTLDPMATGLLTVFVGRATRAVEFAEQHSKRYTAHLRLGVVTDTQDITGNISETYDVHVSDADLDAVLERFTGEQLQTPPMYSAIKVKGKRLYDIARSGGEVERKPRRITVDFIRCVGKDGGDAVLDIACSKGTYVRTLCNDIGAALGCGGCMSALRRTEAGMFSLADAHTLDEVITAANEGRADKLLIPVSRLFESLPEWCADEECERRIKCGNDVKASGIHEGEYRVYSERGEFLMLGRAENGIMKTVKSFFEVS